MGPCVVNLTPSTFIPPVPSHSNNYLGISRYLLSKKKVWNSQTSNNWDFVLIHWQDIGHIILELIKNLPTYHQFWWNELYHIYIIYHYHYHYQKWSWMISIAGAPSPRWDWPSAGRTVRCSPSRSSTRRRLRGRRTLWRTRSEFWKGNSFYLNFSMVTKF